MHGGRRCIRADFQRPVSTPSKKVIQEVEHVFQIMTVDTAEIPYGRPEKQRRVLLNDLPAPASCKTRGGGPVNAALVGRP